MSALRAFCANGIPPPNAASDSAKRPSVVDDPAAMANGDKAPADTASEPAPQPWTLDPLDPSKKPPLDINYHPQIAAAPPSSHPQKTPTVAVDQINELTGLIKKAGDAATKDPLVKKLRDLLSGIQPFMPAKDAHKQIDDAIKSLVNDGADAGIMAILKAVTGKSPSTVPENRNQTGPGGQKDLGEHIFQGPKIPFDTPPKLPPSSTFHYKGGPQKSYAPGAAVRFTVIPPDNFLSLQGAKRLVIVAEADRGTPNPDRFGNVVLDSPAPTPIELTAPQTPGKYVVRVDIGLGVDDSSVEEFEVIAPNDRKRD
jgi:hypothetical protein